MTILPFPGRSARDTSSRVDRVEALLAENESALIRYAARLLGDDPDGARDVVQEAFLRLCRQEDLEGVGREWLFTVTRNLCVDHRRKQGRMTPTDEIEDVHAGRPDAHGAPEPPARVEDEDLAQALGRLPERQQEALRLKFEAGLSYAEIAGVLGTSAGNVGWILHHAIKGLKTRLAPEGGAR
ncbi:MAG: sigma-70 family RNA polymerase sigma factor [Planctomycetota bacterium]